MQALITDRPALHWHASEAVYTDGSKRDSSLSCAWVCPAKSLQAQYRVPGPASELRTILQAELMAIHAAVHTLDIANGVSVMTDSSLLDQTSGSICRQARVLEAS